MPLIPALGAWLSASAMAFSAFAALGVIHESRRPPRPPAGPPRRRIAFLIPGHREGEVLVHAAQSALDDPYPQGLKTVMVLADHCAPEVEAAIRRVGADVLSLALEESTKVRSLKRGLANLSPGWDTIVILDADNLVEPGFCQRVDAAFRAGAQAVQGRRVAKNDDTPMAVLDGLMEDVYNVVYRSGQRALGLPAHLIGSGMAFDRTVLERALQGRDPVGGFDKELQATLYLDGHDIEYCRGAVVYDEKVETAAQLTHQRRRWLSTQVAFIPLYARTAWLGLKRGQLTGLALLGLALLPPRSLLLLGLVAVAAVGALGGWTTTAASCVFAVLSMCLAGVLAAVHSGRARQLGRALPAVPAALFAMVCAALRLRGANRRFIHTPHGRAVGLADVKHREVL